MALAACWAVPSQANDRFSAEAVPALADAAAPGLAVGRDRFREMFDNWAAPHDGAPAGRPAVTFSKASDGLGAPVILRDSAPPVSGGKALVAGTARFAGGLPVSARRITSGFGLRYHPVLGNFRMHSGVDLAAPAGSPVFSPSDGTVSYAAWRGAYGLLVAVEHGAGMQTRFAHLSQVAVAAGQRVRKGQVLGFVGSSGRSTGPHLHYETRVNGMATNPLGYASR